jgi:hypothetical protein
LFNARQQAGLLVLAAISDAQALERSLADTDVMDPATVLMCSITVPFASCIQQVA